MFSELLRNESGWNPPNVSLWGYPDFRDLNGKPLQNQSIYKFPWYLCYMPLWYKFKHWCKNGEWPVSVLYFSDEQQLDKKIFLEVVQHPQWYYTMGPKYTWDLPLNTVVFEDEDFDEDFNEDDIES